MREIARGAGRWPALPVKSVVKGIAGRDRLIRVSFRVNRRVCAMATKPQHT